MARVLRPLLLAGAAQAHFLLNNPVSIGFDDDLEATGPCGSFEPDFNNDTITNWHVSGDYIATQLAHPESNFLYRATLDKTAAGGWVELFPVVQQTGLGDFCEPSVPAPASWVGQQGVLGVVVDGPDGILFQCALVSFVDGTGSPNATTCFNATGVTAALTSDPSLAAFISSSSNTTSNSTSTASPSSSSSSPSASSSKSAAAARVDAGLPALGSLVVVGLMGVLGALLL